jgi:adenylate kinase
MRVLFLGPPGSGKGTQCKKLAEKLGIVHLSSGDLLREAISQNTPAGQSAKSYIDLGKLVPDSTLIQMFREKLAALGKAGSFILDGFPRNISQAASLDQLHKEIGIALNCVINLSIADQLVSERIVGRRSCQSCGAVFHVKFNPPKEENVCDICGHELIQRSDDKAELVQERLNTYHEQTEPLIEYYQARKILQTIDAALSPEEIFSNIMQALESPPSQISKP